MSFTPHLPLLAKAIISIIYASLWIHYISHLATPPTPGQPLRKCREVEPVLRSVLLVFSWLGVVMGVIVFCMLVSVLCVRSSAGMFVVLLLYAILLFIYVYQILYLRAVSVSDQLVDDGCDLIEPKTRRLLMIFAVIVLVFGVGMSVLGIVSGGRLDEWVRERLGVTGVGTR